MLKSEANLVASLQADWSPATLERARSVLARIHAEEEPRNNRQVAAYFDDSISDTAPANAATAASWRKVSVISRCSWPRMRWRNGRPAAAGWRCPRCWFPKSIMRFSIENPLFDRLSQALESRRLPDLRRYRLKPCIKQRVASGGRATSRSAVRQAGGKAFSATCSIIRQGSAN